MGRPVKAPAIGAVGLATYSLFSGQVCQYIFANDFIVLMNDFVVLHDLEHVDFL